MQAGMQLKAHKLSSFQTVVTAGDDPASNAKSNYGHEVTIVEEPYGEDGVYYPGNQLRLYGRETIIRFKTILDAYCKDNFPPAVDAEGQ